MLETVRAAGASVFYEQTDVTDEAEVYRLIRNIRKRHGKLDGIVHSAGIIKDNYMVKKTAEEYQHVLAPKVKYFVYLDEASQHEKLDVFIVFSSLSGVLGSVVRLIMRLQMSLWRCMPSTAVLYKPQDKDTERRFLSACYGKKAECRQESRRKIC